ncbi:MAG: hypothetical protein AB7E80_09765 [Hyphomicrobiaceae bacterium]
MTRPSPPAFSYTSSPALIAGEETHGWQRIGCGPLRRPDETSSRDDKSQAERSAVCVATLP